MTNQHLNVKMRKKDKGKVKPRSSWKGQAQRFGLYAIAILALLFLGAYLLQEKVSMARNKTEASQSTAAESSISETERRMEISDTLFSQTRHIKGDPAAPVTIIEFSDFQ